jgi:hypothetical protein
MTHKTYLTPKQLKDEGFRVLAGPYQLPQEEDMLQAVIRDLHRGWIEYRIGQDTKGHYVCRTQEGWLEGNNEDDVEDLV